MCKWLGSLPASEVSTRLTEASILCLPIGAYEQHGPHLPLHTDTVIAERFTDRLIERYDGKYDLWILPSIPYGLSFEHSWAPGTITLRLTTLFSLLDTILHEYARTCAARRLLIVNGHGGNRGALEAIIYELNEKHEFKIVVIHPSALSNIKNEHALPEIHAGTRETSVMLALSPNEVHLERIPETFSLESAVPSAIKGSILDRGTSWPWYSNDPRLAVQGITGNDPRRASAELGEAIVNSALDACGSVLEQL